MKLLSLRVASLSLLLTLCFSLPAFAADSVDALADPACLPLAELVRTEGQVRVTRAPSPFPLRQLELPFALCAEDQVQTVTGAQALIHYAGGELVLAEQSRLQLRGAEQLELEEGVALFEVSRREGGQFVAQTPLVVIGVKGTRFLVSAQAERHDVALFRGAVEVERQDGQEMAYYLARPIEEMTFAEYRAYQRQQFQQFQQDFNQAFQDYREQVRAEFQAFVRGVDLQPGRQLTLSGADDSVDAIDAPVSESTLAVQEALANWLTE
ncbi:FecR family protein [Marinospirillum sp. MEB164]|uniref:FecR family protein n=1 Tax=Marinospirillum alkalitolerans TaxID=3123374 RepID=A0ABW8PW28_9GAMM